MGNRWLECDHRSKLDFVDKIKVGRILGDDILR